MPWRLLKPVAAVLRPGPLVLALCCILKANAQLQQCAECSSKVTIGPGGSVDVPAYELPLSIYMSEEAKRAYIKARSSPPVELPTDIAQLRETLDRVFFTSLLQRAKAVYPVTIEEQTIGGVRTDVIIAKRGVANDNRDRVLISLHSGGFKTGGGMGALLESIPIAAVGRIKVISIDYRQGPEHKHPSASEDVAAVYAELLKRYEPQNIGMYGCSAGGGLTAMAVAWFREHKLPPPGAIGIFCSGAGARGGGDTSHMARALDPMRVAKPPPTPHSTARVTEYLDGANLRDPLVAPVLYPEILAQFPPTLIITGTRDFMMSSAVHSHTQLIKAGVNAELHVWEGMWHRFFLDVDIPESKEMYEVTAKFFQTQLGGSSQP